MNLDNRSLALDEESTLMVGFLGDLRHSEAIGPTVFGRSPVRWWSDGRPT